MKDIHLKNKMKKMMVIKERLELIRDEIITMLNRYEILGLKIKMNDINNNHENYLGSIWK